VLKNDFEDSTMTNPLMRLERVHDRVHRVLLIDGNKLFSAFFAPSGQDFSSSFSTNPSKETVFGAAFPFGGLVSSFHASVLSVM